MEWGIAIQIFITGVVVVMLVMGVLQLSVQATSVIVRILEKGTKKDSNIQKGV